MFNYLILTEPRVKRVVLVYKKPLLIEEAVELLTSPYDLAEYKTAIMTAMYKGAKREIESEPSKNTTAG